MVLVQVEGGEEEEMSVVRQREGRAESITGNVGTIIGKEICLA